MTDTFSQNFHGDKQDYLVTCPFCAVGCRFKFLKGREEVVFSPRTIHELDYDYQNLVNQGSLCPRGHFAFELLSHPGRLGESFYRGNGRLTAEIPELIFQQIARELVSTRQTHPLAILLDPMLSLHDLRSLIDLARNLQIQAVDIAAPLDRHLFRAMYQLPDGFPRLNDIRKIARARVILCVGDVFTKQPVLSKHILKSRYALRTNRLLHINPLPSRTSWFANQFIQSPPHTEPLILGKILLTLLQSCDFRQISETQRMVQQILERELEPLADQLLSDHRQAIAQISETLRQSTDAVIFYSTHMYNAATSFLNGTLCALIAQLIRASFVPLYTDSNIEALEVLSQEVYPELHLGSRNLLPHILQGKFDYVWAAGWNPDRLFPGNINWPKGTRWILSSMVQTETELPVTALLPQAHPFEQADLRMSFLPHQFIGSEPVISPPGNAQQLSLFALLFHQKLVAQKIRFSAPEIRNTEKSFSTIFEEELHYYLDKISRLNISGQALWLIPRDHVAHYRDGELTRFASWAQKDCDDRQLEISWNVAGTYRLRQNQAVQVSASETETVLIARPQPSLPDHLIIPYAHVPEVRKLMSGEIAPHNSEYYFWCPRAHLQPI